MPMNRFAILLCIMGGATLTACRSPQVNATLDFYPLGIYGVKSTNDFPTIRAAGFNVVVGPATASYLDHAHAAGLSVLASPGTAAGPGFNPQAARSAVKELDGHPALWAWYVVDEPDLNLVPPGDVVHANKVIRQAGATKPTALVIYQGYEALHYANLTDFMMVDRYPIPWLPLANFGQHVEMTRLALGPDKPLLAVIQAFDWNSSRELLRGETNLRPPTYAEMRCMTYEALARGANGLFYFRFQAGGNNPDQEETWEALKAVVREVNDRRALFQGRRLWWPKQHEFGNRATRFNEALQSSITSILLRVETGDANVPAGDYLVAVNNTTNTHTYWCRLPLPGQAAPGSRLHNPVAAELTQRNWKRAIPKETTPGFPATIPVFGEARSIQPLNNWIKDTFEGYAVHVYGPLPKKLKR